MSVIGHGVEICTSTTRPSSPDIGTIIYQTDTDEYLKYCAGPDTINRWMVLYFKSERNILINGGFDVWQRGSTSGTTGYLADRWSATNVNIHARSTDVPTGYTYSISFGNSAASFPYICQRVEASTAVRTVGKRLTFSFWAKSTNGTANLYCELYNATASDNFASVSTIGTAQVASASPSSSWTYYTVTFSTVPAGGANGLEVRIIRNNTSAATTLVTGIQLEIGTAPSEFEFQTYDTTLKRCQRYFCRSLPESISFGPYGSDGTRAAGVITGIGQTGGGGGATMVFFPNMMRTTPSIRFSAWTSGPTSVISSGTFTVHYASVGDGTGTLDYLGRSNFCVRSNNYAAYYFFLYEAQAEL